MSHRRAGLLYVLGHLGAHVAPWKTSVSDPDVALAPGESVLADESLALSAWMELLQNLENTPLLPIRSLADMLPIMLPHWSKKAEWRDLIALVDEAVGKRVGRHAIAAYARDRAMKLLDSGTMP